MTSIQVGLFARFVFDKKRINQHRVRFSEFKPPSNLELSVYKIDGLDYGEIVKIGQGVAKLREKNLIGWAVIQKPTINDVGLEVVIDNNPPGHAIIIGWSADVLIMKDQIKELAALSKPVLLT